jgi:hypothetical protein
VASEPLVEAPARGWVGWGGVGWGGVGWGGVGWGGVGFGSCRVRQRQRPGGAALPHGRGWSGTHACHPTPPPFPPALEEARRAPRAARGLTLGAVALLVRGVGHAVVGRLRRGARRLGHLPPAGALGQRAQRARDRRRRGHPPGAHVHRPGGVVAQRQAGQQARHRHVPQPQQRKGKSRGLAHRRRKAREDEARGPRQQVRGGHRQHHVVAHHRRRAKHPKHVVRQQARQQHARRAEGGQPHQL